MNLATYLFRLLTFLFFALLMMPHLSWGQTNYYPFNGNANDESGNGRNGVVLGATPTIDRFGNPNSAYSFDGLNDYINIPLPSISSHAFSFCGWLRTDGLNNSQASQIFFGGRTGTTTTLTHLGTELNDTGMLYAQVKAGSNDRPTIKETNSSIHDGQWHLYCVTLSSTAFILYLDGQVVAEDNTFTTSGNMTNKSILGGYSDNDSSFRHFYEGDLDDVRIYDRVLTDTEIQALYSEGGWTGNNDLVAHYPFSGNADDSSGNALHLTGNAMLTSDRFNTPNSAFLFNGVDDHFEVDNTRAYSTASISYWFKTSAQDENTAVLLLGPSGQFNSDVGLKAPGSVRFWWQSVRRLAPRDAHFTNTNYADDTWHHVVVVREGSGVNGQRIYINGVHDTNTTVDKNENAGNVSATRIYVGANGGTNPDGTFTGLNRYFDGSLDDIRIYNRALTDTEIQELYSEGGWPNVQTPLTISNIAVTPSGPVDRGEEVTFEVTVVDNQGNPIEGGTVSGDDFLQGNQFSAITDQNGKATYSSTVPQEQASGPYNFSFTATKQDFLDSATETRQIAVRHFGTTVITHGLNFPDLPDDLIDGIDDLFGTDQNWTLSMAGAIVERLGRGCVVGIVGGSFESYYCLGEGGETVLVFDWLEESTRPSEGYAEAAGDALAALLIKGYQEGAWPLDQLHFIGHSRGAIVMSEAIQRLALYAGDGIDIDNDIHFTTLDAHPWDDNIVEDNVGDPLSAGDSDVNGLLNSSGVACWWNVGYLENYWHATSVTDDLKDLDGLDTITGCTEERQNQDLSALKEMTHGGVHAWYHGTIDLDAVTDNDVESPIQIIDDASDTWYPTVGILGDAREWDGFNQTLSAGVTEPSIFLEVNRPSQGVSPYLDNTLQAPTIFNGDLEKGVLEFSPDILLTPFLPVVDIITGKATTALTLNVLFTDNAYDRPVWDWAPGWEQHGGDANLSWLELNGFNLSLNRSLLVSADQSGKHNWLYIPKDATTLHFRAKWNGFSVSRKLTVRVGEENIRSISQFWPDYTYKSYSIPIPPQHRGTVKTLEFLLENSTGGLSSVHIDDISFDLQNHLFAAVRVKSAVTLGGKNSTLAMDEGRVRLHAYDELGNHTGPTSNGAWEANIPGSRFISEKTIHKDPRQIIILPEGGVYHFSLESDGFDGIFDFQIDDVKADDQTPTILFSDVEAGTTMKASLSLTNVHGGLHLGVDDDGDGIIDDHIAPSAYFEEFSLTASAGENGSITPEGSSIVNYGDSLSFIINAEEGYYIEDVLVDGESIDRVDAYTFSHVNADHTISVMFAEDTTAPEITLNGDNPLNLIRFGVPYEEPGATVVDDFDEAPSLTITGADAIDINLPGVYLVTYQATDESGNTAQVIRTVNVIDDPDALPHTYLFLADKKLMLGKMSQAEGDFHSNDEIDLKKGPVTYLGNVTAVGKVDIDKNITIQGDVSSADELQLSSNVTITGTASEHASVASVALSALSFSAGGNDIKVEEDQTQALSPGSYGKIEVEEEATLQLASGDYFFEELIVKEEASLEIDVSVGPVTVNVEKKIDLDEDVAMRLSPLGAVDSRYVTFNTQGDVQIGEGSVLLGSFIAPEGKVDLKKGVSLQGSVCAEEIDVDKAAVALHHALGFVASKQGPADTTLPDVPEAMVEEPTEETVVPDQYALHGNYPNPFNPSTEIGFTLPEAVSVTLVVYNVRGREVAHLVNGPLAAGTHQVTFEASRLPSGVYFIRLEAGAYVETRRMVLMK